MTKDTGLDTFDALRELAELQRESDRLRVATAARITYEEVIARHDELKETGPGTNLREFAEVREEAAPYLSGRRPVPPPVPSAELIAYARRRIEVFGRLAEAGIEGAAEGVTEAEAELAEELRKVPEIELVSFGFLHGPAPEADLVVDMRRHFRDPHVNPEMRQLTAEHELVTRAVFNTDGVPELARAILAAVESFRAGPSAGTVRVAVGCAGGRHRSAAMVNYLAMQYGAEVKVTAEHRDIHRPVVER
ncbi:RapZ C-terminal domain-containing protein [Streptomyces halstedii]|uniref:RapZ C-terminal domain-containing protein n=1 Tax=Streptomyces halstedii TaxID=1944 RepID=UPI00099D3F12